MGFSIGETWAMKQWVLAIGINHYHFFQPISYGQDDAQALQQFLVYDAGVPLNQCLLLADHATSSWGRSAYPSRANILGWLDFLLQRYVQSGDHLWIFFSGYGLTYHGQDYLLPIDANPAAISSTAIPVEVLYKHLCRVPGVNVLVLLDISRSQARLSHEDVGSHTARVASQWGIATILSCQPGQFSHEGVGLTHGLFTSALLDCLRDRPDHTLAGLAQCLERRLPELCEHTWRPLQQPLAIIPPHLLYQPLLLKVVAPQPIGRTDTPQSPPIHTALQQDYDSPSRSGGTATLTATPPIAMPPMPHAGGAVRSAPLPSPSRGPVPATGPIFGTSPPPPTSLPEPAPTELEIPDGTFWKPALLFGGLATAVMFFGVLWRQSATFIPVANVLGSYTAAVLRPGTPMMSPSPHPPSHPSTPSPTLEKLNPPPLSFNPVPSGNCSIEQVKTLASQSLASPLSDQIQQLEQVVPGDPDYAAAQEDITCLSQAIWTIAQDRRQQTLFDVAIMAATLIPEQQAVYSEVKAVMPQWCGSLNPQGTSSTQQRARAICEQWGFKIQSRPGL